MTYVKFQALDVGQGLGTFVEVYGDNDELTHTVLMDLGTEDERDTAGLPSVNYIATQLKTMPAPTIDVLFISHGDTDHHSLLWDLLDNFEDYTPGDGPRKEMLYIESARYGGHPDHFKKSSGNILKRLQDFMGKDQEPRPVPPFRSDFRVKSGEVPKPSFEVSDDVSVFYISGNTWTPAVSLLPRYKMLEKNKKKAKSYLANTVSLVLLLRFNSTGDNVQFVVTGDATGCTMAACNMYVADADAITFMNNVFTITAPHHGSSSTAFNAAPFLNSGKDPAGTVTEFAGKIRAKSITASAATNKYDHPGFRLLNYFNPNLAPQPYYKDNDYTDQTHFYTAHFVASDNVTVEDPPGSKQYQQWPPHVHQVWHTVRTMANIYTNTYYSARHNADIIVPPLQAAPAAKPTHPPHGVSWEFLVAANGDMSLERRTNRAALDALLVARLAVPRPAVPAMLRPIGEPARPRGLRVFP